MSAELMLGSEACGTFRELENVQNVSGVSRNYCQKV